MNGIKTINQTKKNNKPLIIKFIFLIMTSNLLTYLLFTEVAPPDFIETKVHKSIPKDFIPVNVPINNFATLKEGDHFAAISLLTKHKKLFIEKAFLISSKNNNEYEERSLSHHSELGPTMMIAIHQSKLNLIINNKSWPLYSYPPVKKESLNEKTKRRSQSYEVIF
jgi:hypothetical protein